MSVSEAISTNLPANAVGSAVPQGKASDVAARPSGLSSGLSGVYNPCDRYW